MKKSIFCVGLSLYVSLLLPHSAYALDSKIRLSINGVSSDTPYDQIRKDFKQRRQIVPGRVLFSRDGASLQIDHNTNGTCEVSGTRLEIDGKDVLLAGERLRLQTVEKRLQGKAKMIAKEHDMLWYLFEKDQLTLGVGTHGSLRNKVSIFSLRYHGRCED